MKRSCLLVLLIVCFGVTGQTHERLYTIANAISKERLKNDVKTLVNFGTRHTLSDTLSKIQGIGAARRWIKSEFETISKNCNSCLEVFYQNNMVKKGTNSRITKDVNVVNVVAIQRGTTYPNHYIIMSGDIDSRVSDPNNFTSDAPGANDNATGMAGTIEAARILSKYRFKSSIIYTGLSGEEQGLFGGKGLAGYAKANNWNIIGVLNNDMIGNIKGVDGVIDNRTFRIFSEAITTDITDAQQLKQQAEARRYYGGEVDGTSRQLARYVYNTTKTYMPEMRPMLVYRLDRFGRGGHHKPFNDAGFAGIRIMEAHENYTQQHQDIRTENGINYGDTFAHVNFLYCKKLTAVNAINLANLASAPPAPAQVSIGGIVEASVKLKWNAVKGAKGYKVYWRNTTSPTWDNSRYVGNLTEFTLDGFVIDNYLFGVASVSDDNYESVIVFPNKIMR